MEVYAEELLLAIQQNDEPKLSKIIAECPKTATAACGRLNITAVQIAAAFDRTGFVEILVKSGADVNSADSLGRTPLSYASTNGNYELCRFLIDNGAELNSKFKFESKREQGAFKSTSLLGLLNSLTVPECWGRTPLHQAVKGGHAGVVKLLIEHGADVNIEDERKVTPLLLAAPIEKCLIDYEHIVQCLVNAGAEVNVHNKDTGTTPLHHAANFCSLQAVECLLSAGAKIVPAEAGGQTPLHEAACHKWVSVLEVLLKYDKLLVNRADALGRTPLHRAAYSGSRECLNLLLDYGGDLSAKTSTGISVMSAIFTHIPRPTEFISEVLDKKITSNNVSVNNVDFHVKLDFRMLIPRGIDQMTVILSILHACDDNNILQILQHPLLETFLRIKWQRLRIFFFLLVVIHLMFVISLSTYAVFLTRKSGDYLVGMIVSRSVLILSATVLVGHALVEGAMVPIRQYLRQYEMWLSLFCALLSLIIAIFHQTEFLIVDSDIFQPAWVLHSTSIAVLLAWSKLMFLVGRFPTYGYYALMFSTVLQNVIKVLLAFICLVFGFALSFSIQFHHYEQFKDPWRAIVKTTVMMMGEYEYAELFKPETQDKNLLPVTSRTIFLLFIILASIVLMNLMVGLAVSDIQGLQKEGHVRRLVKQAIFLAHLETVLSHRFLRSDWFPKKIRYVLDHRRCIPTVIVIQPGAIFTAKTKHNYRLPHCLLETIIDIVVRNKKSMEILEVCCDKMMIDLIRNVEKKVDKLKELIISTSKK